MIGLSADELRTMQALFEKNDRIKEVVLFGSRALGTNKTSSDVDLALKGTIDIDTVASLKYALEEETIMPYFFDIVNYHTIANDTLRKHIDTYGKTIWKA